MTESWTRLRALFAKAHELPVEEREGFLAEHCADEALRAEVESLLAVADAASARFDAVDRASPGIGILEDRLRDALTSQRIGAYRLGRVVAEGGMGIVFEAEQASPQRKVALKMLKLGFDSPEAARRFRYEAQLLGRLRHPGIAQVFEAGVHAPAEGARTLPWFAMELVEDARDLLSFATEANLSVRARIELFCQVCDAVEHGHTRGVVHRDLKPANLLVDRQGRAKVIDFGVARAIEADAGLTSVRTLEGQIVGTLAYMSPEQVAGDLGALDTRSDVYSLGVVLYELLCGGLPYDLAERPIHEIARVVREERPRRPSTLARGLAGDLDAVLLKALAKEPGRRYGGVAAFAADLRRFLRREPIEARSPSVVYQLRMFGRRNRLLVASVLLVGLASVVATVVSLRAAAQARIEGERSRALASDLVDLNHRIIDDFFRRIEDLPGGRRLERDLANEVRASLERLAKQAPAEPEIGATLALAHFALADSFEGGAEQQKWVESGYALATQLAEEHGGSHRVAAALMQGIRRLGHLALRAGDSKTATRHFEALVELAEQGDAHSRIVIGASLNELVQALIKAGETKRARELAARALGILERFDVESPLIARQHYHCARAHQLVAWFDSFDKNYPACIEHCREGVELMRLAHEAWPQNLGFRRGLANAHCLLGGYLFRSEELELLPEGAEQFAEAVARYEGVLAAEPDDDATRAELTLAYLEFAELRDHHAHRLGERHASYWAMHDEARGFCAKGLALWKRASTPASAKTAERLRRLRDLGRAIARELRRRLPPARDAGK